MSGSFGIEGGNLVIREGDRVPFTTAGKPVNLLPGEVSTTVSVAFPDFTKDRLYTWWWTSDYNSFAGNYAQDNGCQSYVTVRPQEWAQTSNILAAPSGADFFAGRVRINRTGAPSHSWGGSPINVLPLQNQWLPFSGSVLVEAELAMARAFSIYISGGNLVLHRQQSVGAAPGGFGDYGDANPVFQADAWGGQNTFQTAAGLPVLRIDQRDSPAVTRPTPVAGFPTNHHSTGADACSLTDPTNFASTYAVEIVGRFGRRSK